MKKSDFLKTIACALPVILVMISWGCEEDYGLTPATSGVYGTAGISVTPSGGIFKALGGNITLNFPSDALLQPTTFSVSIVMSKPLEESASNDDTPGFVLKTIIIEPFMVFNKPVQISMRCDGCLWNGVSIQDGMSLKGSMWQNETCFWKSEEPCICTTCNKVPGTDFITMCICQSGVVAVQAE